ncbi:DUF1127 domain-containing protein [uncultured Vibrio sp.]|uniref:DUF1127 domain-containing protein n=1 Tax=uncultured Vibrio sp. TaxID=114054 RepID=UPI00091671F0|nr:DUF1127 domain-containing protein [uncultured Vibrio sp.]OIQ25660.1 MAG: hypothetical protein BM561_04465 [Vibrio sp. MedPE-SWchi]
MTTTIISSPSTNKEPSVNLIKAFFPKIKRWLAKSRSRKQLAALSSHMLRDIGVSEKDALMESERPFWD